MAPDRREPKTQRLIRCLGAAHLATITENSVACRVCGWEMLRNHHRLIEKTEKHFGSNLHRTKCQWSLKVDVHGEYFIKPDNSTLMHQKLETFFERENDDDIDMAHGSGDGLNENDHHVGTQTYYPNFDTVDVQTGKSFTSMESKSSQTIGDNVSFHHIFETSLQIQDIPGDNIKNSIEKFNFVKRLVPNLVRRWCSNFEEGTVPKLEHDPVIKDTISKFALKHSTAAALDFSKLVAGTGKSTIKLETTTANTVKVLEWVEKENLKNHIHAAKEVLQSRVKENVDDVDWIVGFDSTPTNGKFGILDDEKDSGKSYVIGADHAYNKPIELSQKVEGDGSQLLTSTGIINGARNVNNMNKTGKISPAAQIAALVLVPLIALSFSYNMVAIPLGNMLKHIDLHRCCKLAQRVAQTCKVKISAIVGDGDSRLSAIQRLHYTHFPDIYCWVKNLEFPIIFGLQKDYLDFPMQDILHVIKKLRNNMKYLGTKLLLFCDPNVLTKENRLKYCATWEAVVHLWNTNKQFKRFCERSSIALTDKQDPSLVTQVMFCYSLFYEAGLNATGFLFEAIYLVFIAFYDKSLHPLRRIEYAASCKAMISLWREALQKQRCLGKHF